MTFFSIKNMAVIAGSMLFGGAVAVGLYSSFANENRSESHTPTAQTERTVLFWYDPMYPSTRFDQPGKSPFMDMDLVPKYADEGSGDSSAGIHIDPTQTQNLGLKIEPVRLGPLNYSQTFPANVSFNEYQFVIVQARSDGFIHKTYPLTVGDKVKKGTALVDLTIPEWVEAQSEYLLLLEMNGTAIQIEGVLERLRLAGMPENDIQRLQRTQKIQTLFTLRAPIDGVVTAFDLRTGMNINKADVVAKIQGMDPVWITAAIPESAAWRINDEAKFEISIPAWPNKPLTINQWSILPSVEATTRTLQLRFHVDNPDNLLKPGMNAYLTLNTHSQPMLLIPSTALIDTGVEQRVITVDSSERFVPKTVQVFADSKGMTAIQSGLEEGERVVSTGVFLIDSEANIAGALDRMRAPESAEHSHSMNHHEHMHHDSMDHSQMDHQTMQHDHHAHSHGGAH